VLQCVANDAEKEQKIGENEKEKRDAEKEQLT